MVSSSFYKARVLKCIGCILLKVFYGKKGHKLCIEIPKPFGNNPPSNCKDIFMVTQLYIRYVVIYIVFITVMLAIGLFYLTQLCLFLGYFFEYLSLFITIGFQYIIDKF